ncbi:S41 family peptidase [Robertkochia sediminum]|uniref:S41 family peptidase n=1 Tax=Robertkochia sediminum TaxID=2785326 RepID=UPI001933DB18|nr:S41 family peptidase [Robertkochia sediminum]MBL7472934.1 hypothetical protein [Robertkochia sediminum]
MKNIIMLLCAVLTLLPLQAQDAESADWKSDINYLKELIDKEYPFLYKKVTREEFQDAADALLLMADEAEDHEMATGLMKLIALFGYGHTSVGLGNTPYDLRQLPVHLKQFKDGIYIEGVREEFSNDVGARVLKIQGRDIDEVYKKVITYFPAENSQFFKAYGMSYLVFTEILTAEGFIEDPTVPVTLTLVKDGKEYDREMNPMEKGERTPASYGYTQNKDGWISARDTNATPNYLKHLERIYYKEYLEDHNAMYVRQSQIKDDSLMAIPEFYDEVFKEIEAKNIEKLVIDVRLNGGGNNYKNRAVLKDIIAHPEIDKVGNLFVILGDRTFSACQNLVNELDNYTNAIFVGEPTGENINFYGDNNKEELPNSKIPVYLSFAWWQDKPQWENQEWLPPHVAVQMTFEEFANNQDPVLEAALNFKDDNFVLDPMDYLTSLFMKGDIETLKKEAFRFSKDERYVFFDLEQRFIEVGERLTGTGMVHEALFVHQLNTELYPESVATWYALGRTLKEAGMKAESLEAAQKAMELASGQPQLQKQLKDFIQTLE